MLWEDIQDLLLDSYIYSLRQGQLSTSQRNGVISLFLKKDKDPLNPKSYRPISLLTVDYKILAKAIATCIKTVIRKIIDEDQSGFMKGRPIGHNIRQLLDVIEYTDFESIPGAVVLLDIEKAFDSIDHDFLFKTLKHFNFGDKFISNIKTLYLE